MKFEIECGPDADTKFGPSVASCRRDFDFTLQFEGLVLGLVPAAVFAVLAAVRILSTYRRPDEVHRHFLYAFKLGLSLVLLVVQLVILGVQSHDSHLVTPGIIAAAAFEAVAALCILPLSHYDHLKARRPSPLLVADLFLTVLFVAARVRTQWLVGDTVLASLFSGSLVIRLVLLVSESQGKGDLLRVSTGGEIASENLAGPINRVVFQWLNPLIMRGYRQLLSSEDLVAIDSRLLSQQLRLRFRPVLSRTQQGTNLAWLTLRSLGTCLLGTAVARFVLTAFTFTQPFLVKQALLYLEFESPTPRSHGYGLICAGFLCYVGIAAATAWYWHSAYRSGVMVRGGLCIVIFEKLLRLPENDDVESLAMTLMIGDVQRIMNATCKIHEVWAATAETGLATWLLYREVGAACFVMLGIAAAVGLASTQLLKLTSRSQQVWLGQTQNRLKHTKNILDSLKAIKMMSEGNRTYEKLSKVRGEEINSSAPFRRSLVASVFLSYSTLMLSPPLVLAVYVGTAGSNPNFSVSKIFTALTIISLLSSPLVYLFQVLPTLGAAHGCFGRVQQYLRRRERPEADSSQLPEDTHQDTTASLGGPVDEPTDKVVLSLRNVSLGWTPDRPLLSGVDLDVHRGERIAILGPVGSGKSLFLKGLIQEAHQFSGTLKKTSSTRLAYCGQRPWLENLSAYQNITQYTSETAKLEGITGIIQDCDLGGFAGFEAGAETVGSNGVGLSGGQRQRLALARALASGHELLVLDDIFSGLDRKTRWHIANNILKRNTRSAGRTIVYATNDEEMAACADAAYEIQKDGQLVRRAGTLLGRTSPSALTADTHLSVPDVTPGNTNVEVTERKQLRAAAANDKSTTEAAKTAMATPVTDRAAFLRYFQANGKLHSTIFVLGAMAWSLTYKFSDIWVAWWSDAFAAGDYDTRYWLGSYAAFGIAALVALSAWLGHQQLFMILKSGLGLHNQLLTTVLKAQFPIISRMDTGNILNRFNQDLMFVDFQLPMDLFNTASSLCIAVIQIVLIAVASLYALCVVPVMFAVMFTVQRIYLRTAKQLRAHELEAKAALHTKLSEASTGLATIRTHGWTDSVFDKFLEKLDRSQEPVYLLYALQRWLQLVINLTVAGMVTVVLGASVALREKHTVSAGAMGVAFLQAVTLGETLIHLIDSYTSFQISLGAVARLISFEREMPVEDDEAGAGRAPSQELPLKQEKADHGALIHFRNVWATYGDPDSDPSTATWGLRGVSFEVRPGERVTVCGETGSGKSTLHLALLRMVHMPIGAISIDGVDHQTTPLEALRKKFCVISQDKFEGSNSLRDELDPDGDLTDEQLSSACQDCGILEQVIKAGGFNAPRDSYQFSEGEEQLLNIVRVVLLAKRKDRGDIILLDEVTSSVDPRTENRVEQLISTELAGKTVIAINHRLEAAMKYDRIIVLEGGQVVDVGTPAELSTRCSLFQGLGEALTKTATIREGLQS